MTATIDIWPSGSACWSADRPCRLTPIHTPIAQTTTMIGTPTTLTTLRPPKPITAVASMTSPQPTVDTSTGTSTPKDSPSSPEKAAPTRLALIANHPTSEAIRSVEISHRAPFSPNAEVEAAIVGTPRSLPCIPISTDSPTTIR